MAVCYTQQASATNDREIPAIILVVSTVDELGLGDSPPELGGVRKKSNTATVGAVYGPVKNMDERLEELPMRIEN